MAKSNNKDNKSFRSRLVAKYRFVVLNENTFEEMLSYKLSRLNVFMILSISAILLIAATYLIISVTPLKEYIPGYDSTVLRRQAINNTYLIDSLQQQLFLNERYITSIADALSGNVDIEDIPSSGSIDDIDQLQELGKIFGESHIVILYSIECEPQTAKPVWGKIGVENWRQ